MPSHDRKSTRLNSSHTLISYAVFCLKKKKTRLNSMHTHTFSTRLLSAATQPAFSLCLSCFISLRSLAFVLVFFLFSFFFFFKDTAPPEIYPFPLHDALPI